MHDVPVHWRPPDSNEGALAAPPGPSDGAGDGAGEDTGEEAARPVSTHVLVSEQHLGRLRQLAHTTRVAQSEYLREAVDDLLAKYGRRDEPARWHESGPRSAIASGASSGAPHSLDSARRDP